MIQCHKPASTCQTLLVLSRLTPMEAMGTIRAQGTRERRWQGLYRIATMGTLDMAQSSRLLLQCRYEVKL